MTLDPITIGFILFIVALVTVYDVWTLVRRGYNTTISWTLYAWATRWPIIPFALGVLAGHLFFPNKAGM